MTGSAPALLSLPAPPPGEWGTWLIEGDRATGKTTCGARWLLWQALAAPEGSLWAVCAPTWDRARYSLEALTGMAGWAVEAYARTRLDVTLRNKARIRGFSSESPDRIRGYNFSGAWFDDIDAIRHHSFYRDGLLPSLRARNPRLVVTAGLEYKTPLVRDLEQEAEDGSGRVVLTVL